MFAFLFTFAVAKENNRMSASNLNVIGWSPFAIVVSVVIAVFVFQLLAYFVYCKWSTRNLTNVADDDDEVECLSIGDHLSSTVRSAVETASSILYSNDFRLGHQLKATDSLIYTAKFEGDSVLAKLSKKEGELSKENDMMKELASPWTVRAQQMIIGLPTFSAPDPECFAEVLILEDMNLGPLSKYLDSSVKHELVLSQSLSIITMLAKGIEFIHSKGYSHLAIKPENILLHQDPDHPIIAKIIGFNSTIPMEKPQPKKTFTLRKRKPIQQGTDDILGFGKCLLSIKASGTNNYAWNFIGTTTEQRRELLKKDVSNVELIELMLDCLQDDPSLRPTASNIVERLKKFKQSDFYVSKSENTTVSRIFPFPRSRPTTPVKSAKSPSKSYQFVESLVLQKRSPGKQLLKLLQLPKQTKWSDFIIAFRKVFQIRKDFNSTAFKKMFNLESDHISDIHLNKVLFKSMPPLVRLRMTKYLKVLFGSTTKNTSKEIAIIKASGNRLTVQHVQNLLLEGIDPLFSWEQDLAQIWVSDLVREVDKCIRRFTSMSDTSINTPIR
ncbi:hypothetical protein HDV02_003371 [Globomyces sp. JEL0801]|nr:hypothetical protein HDV02_003371 [Globomyces sp. JEL0801]